jgi:hypothetical protein
MRCCWFGGCYRYCCNCCCWALIQYQLCSQLPEQLPASQVAGSDGDQAGVDLMAGEGEVLGPEEDQCSREQGWLWEAGQRAQGVVVGHHLRAQQMAQEERPLFLLDY